MKFDDIPTRPGGYLVAISRRQHFFSHSGFDPIRVVKAAYVDIKKGRRAEGASTLSMQLAKNFFLEQDKRWSTKLAEVIITLQLEQKLTKQKIFEVNANPGVSGLPRLLPHPRVWRGSGGFLGKELAQDPMWGKPLNWPV